MADTATATVDVESILSGDKVEVADLERLRRAAFESEGVWQKLKAAAADYPEKPSGSAGARTKRGFVLWTLGRLPQAVRELEDPAGKGESFASLVLARVHLDQKEPEKALKTVEAALKKEKKDPDLRLAAVEARREAGEVDAALEAALALERELGDRAELHFQVGACLELIGRHDEAMDRFEDAIARDPAHARALFRLANQNELRGSLDVAVEYYERATNAIPTPVNALVNLGLLYEDLGQDRKAIECYQRILMVQPTHQRARMFLKDAEASLDMYYDEDQEKKSDRRNAILRIPITDFELSVRARNCLAKMNIRNLGDLVQKTEQELLAYKNFGETSLQEIKQMLAQKGLRLGMFREEAAGGGAVGIEGAALGGAEEVKPQNQELLAKPIAEIELSVRSRNCMERLNIKTIGELVSRSEQELLAVKNFGQTSLQEIKKRLGELGLSLRSDGAVAGGAEGPKLDGLVAALGGAGLGGEEEGAADVDAPEEGGLPSIAAESDLDDDDEEGGAAGDVPGDPI